MQRYASVLQHNIHQSEVGIEAVHDISINTNYIVEHCCQYWCKVFSVVFVCELQWLEKYAVVHHHTTSVKLQIGFYFFLGNVSHSLNKVLLRYKTDKTLFALQYTYYVLLSICIVCEVTILSIIMCVCIL